MTVSSFNTCELGLSEDLSVFVCLGCVSEVANCYNFEIKFLRRTSSVSWITPAEQTELYLLRVRSQILVHLASLKLADTVGAIIFFL